MTPERINIKIAEACGWTATENHGSMGGWIAKQPNGGSVYDAIGGTKDDAISRACPDYYNDLNACHEMEKVLFGKMWSLYSDHLALICDGMNSRIHATAPQRCETFLRTLGLWKEDK